MKTLALRKTDRAQFSAEASDLGLKPGEWPQEFEVTFASKTYKFVNPKFVVYGGDVVKVEYVSTVGGQRATIWND